MTNARKLVAPSLAESSLLDSLPWIEPAAAGLVVTFAALSLVEIAVAYVTNSMPPLHYIAVPIAVGIIVVVWFAELAGLRLPRLLFAALVTAPQVWLAAIGHGNLNYLFLLLTVAWVGASGSRLESRLTLAMNLAVVGVIAVTGILHGQFAIGGWGAWAVGVFSVWLMTRGLVYQQQLADELRAAQSDLERRTRQTAVLEERQRLARELHDAVTQTLFAGSLIADVLPRIWERDPAEGRRRLEELRGLTRGALAEMRTLLYELRPAALTEMPLGDLLRQLTDAATGSARVPVALTVEGSGALPPDVQIAFYRIAQEALNNVAKHARAGHAEVLLAFRPDEVQLSVCDDGQGFDPARIPAGHLGVGIMQERAAEAGAALCVESRPGEGSRVTVTWRDGGRSAEDD